MILRWRICRNLRRIHAYCLRRQRRFLVVNRLCYRQNHLRAKTLFESTSIDSAHEKSIDSPKEESVDSSPEDWENDYYNPIMVTHTRDTMHTEEYDEDYEEERAVEYKAIIDEDDRLLHHSSWKRNAPKFGTCKDVTKQINTKQKPVGKEHISAILARESTAHRSTTNIHHRSTFVRNNHPLDPDGYARAIDGHALQVSREDIAYILQMANGAENLFMQQRNNPAHQQKVTNDFYGTACGIDNRLKQNYIYPTRPSIDVDVLSSIDRRPEFRKRAI
ncbi:hypothetical protein F2Q69_00005916 [Brassica cretica]|uniref:Uncharacterized protein n=1 Tax=Brassica cretica TaxID=69181 RepID=A0A8S9P0W5_BRACR|nr:hypothetical protein F2Q69_00005916 [Brassica cretica]